jgi:hypothetical protein
VLTVDTSAIEIRAKGYFSGFSAANLEAITEVPDFVRKFADASFPEEKDKEKGQYAVGHNPS